jgi:DNA modification methylase
MKVKNQVITDNYALYNSDCMYVLPTLADKSIDLSVYSPPFAGLYNYSSSENDFSNCETKEQFLQQYEFLIKEIARVTKDGRITAVHCTDVMDSKTGKLWDFPHEIIKLHEKYGFDYRNKITVWKEPLKVRMRTMVKSLMHLMIVEDSTQCFTAMPDYILIFKKRGENLVPVTHPCGLKHYAGEYPMLIDHLGELGANETAIYPIFDEAKEKLSFELGIKGYIKNSFKELQKKYMSFGEKQDHKLNKLSHIIWRRYASSVWDDIRIDEVLPFQDSKDEDDEKHVHPLQLDVIDRLVELYSNPNEVVLTPFMGVGSEVYSPVSLGRKAIGIELKDSYFKQAVLNLQNVKNRFKDEKQLSILDAI